MEAVKKNNVFVYTFLFLFGLFFPTSLNKEISLPFYIISAVILILILIVLIPKKIERLTLSCFVFVNISLIIFTITSSLYELSLGIYLNFLILSLLFLCDLRGVIVSSIIRYVFIVSSILLIILGLGVILQSETITDFIINWYSASYEDLLPRMIAVLKPVGTFATHSVAALFSFLFFYLNTVAYKKTKSNIYLILAGFFLIFLFFIRSNTSLLYMGISIIIFLNLLRNNKKASLLILAFGGISLYFILSSNNFLNQIIGNFNLLDIYGSEGNGISGRYSENSVLQPTIDYIMENPFSPIGLSYSDKLYYTDSGFILYMLRGSFLMPIVIYIGTFFFFLRNIANRKTAYLLFFSILIFEIGYPILINIRMLYFLPIIVILVNHLDQIEHDKS